MVAMRVRVWLAAHIAASEIALYLVIYYRL
jgi:hypothetical protein